MIVISSGEVAIQTTVIIASVQGVDSGKPDASIRSLIMVEAAITPTFKKFRREIL